MSLMDTINAIQVDVVGSVKFNGMYGNLYTYTHCNKVM